MDPGGMVYLDNKSNTRKRKFAPNISKALAKKSQADNTNGPPRPRKPTDSVRNSGSKRHRINRNLLEGEDSRYVQSYSIFEKGVGCVTKPDETEVEMRSISTGNAKTPVKSIVRSSSPTIKEPDRRFDASVTDIQQYFKFPPTCMPPDPPNISSSTINSTHPDGPASKNIPLSINLSQLFDDTLPNGSLFSLRIPDVLLSEESPLQNEGKFGKIQLLDNGETRLVIGDCFLRLTSSGPTPYSSDVVLVEDESGEEDGGMVNLNSLGHIDQFVTAVPELDFFSKLGR